MVVLKEGSAKLNVMSGSRDGGDTVVDLDRGTVVVTVTIRTDVIEPRDDSEAMYDQLPLPCSILCELTLSWSSVLVSRTGTTWHAWIYHTATTEIIAPVENASRRTVIGSPSKLWYHDVRRGRPRYVVMIR